MVGLVGLGLMLTVPSLAAETTGKAPPLAGAPSTDYATIVQELAATKFAIIDYGRGDRVLMSDPEWLGPLMKLIAGADGQADTYCFCSNWPRITFVGKDGSIAVMEIPHGEKFRFGGNRFQGDFLVGKTIGKLARDLLMLPHDRASLPTKANPSLPFKPVTTNPYAAPQPAKTGSK